MSPKYPLLPHFFLPPNHGKASLYTARGGGSSADLPSRDREAHAQMLETTLVTAMRAGDALLQQRDPAIAGGKEGYYLDVKLAPKQTQALERWEKHGVELMTVQQQSGTQELIATVFMPKGTAEKYAKKIEEYRTKPTRTGNPKHQPLVAATEAISLASVRSVFTDDPRFFPTPHESIFWEVWLNHDREEVFRHAAAHLSMEIRRRLHFIERDVLLVIGTAALLEQVMCSTDAIAELRRAKDTPVLFMEMGAREQREWTEELTGRIDNQTTEVSPTVCLLDTGSSIQHPLINPFLASDDCQAYHADWNAVDTHGHGTGMSGLALYGDLAPVLESQYSATVKHRLESVKLLPDDGHNDPDLYGAITSESIARAEIAAPNRPRVICMAVTTEEETPDRQTAWSAALDNQAYGDGTGQRLITVSAGNIGIQINKEGYLNNCDVSPIQNPSQAWNVLTVGAFTERCTIMHPDYKDWNPLAETGDLCPTSRTSVGFLQAPIKPEIVCEGGNMAIPPSAVYADFVDDLQLLTCRCTGIDDRMFDVIGETSAATAQAARMAAQIMAEHPNLWAETVRALMVHSADWTPAMWKHLPTKYNKTDLQQILRRYGYGVPNLERALHSMHHAVTMVVEDSIQPFEKRDGSIRTCQMKLHQFRFPSQLLEELSAENVRMKVTLSYFIEPNPGQRHWAKKHSYASHGLRFKVKAGTETPEQFHQRINAAVQAEEEGTKASSPDDSGWLLGANLRKHGSLHVDIWEGTAADLASKDAIAIYPTGGWWREKPALKRETRTVRYALIISLQAPEGKNIDIYTPIANLLKPKISIEV